MKEPKRDCINYNYSSLTPPGACRGLKELICVTGRKQCPFYKSNKKYFTDGSPREE